MLLPGISQNYVGSFFPHHIDRTDNEKSWYSRENRRVHHSQSLGPVDAKLRI